MRRKVNLPKGSYIGEVLSSIRRITKKTMGHPDIPVDILGGVARILTKEMKCSRRH